MTDKLTWEEIVAAGLEIGQPGTSGTIVISEKHMQDPSVFIAELLETCFKAQAVKNDHHPQSEPLAAFFEPAFGTPVLDPQTKTYSTVGLYQFSPTIQLSKV